MCLCYLRRTKTFRQRKLYDPTTDRGMARCDPQTTQISLAQLQGVLLDLLSFYLIMIPVVFVFC